MMKINQVTQILCFSFWLIFLNTSGSLFLVTASTDRSIMNQAQNNDSNSITMMLKNTQKIFDLPKPAMELILLHFLTLQDVSRCHKLTKLICIDEFKAIQKIYTIAMIPCLYVELFTLIKYENAFMFMNEENKAFISSNSLICTKAYVLLKKNGKIKSWGNTDLQPNIETIKPFLQNIEKIYKNEQSFAALKNDGSVITWGNFEYGGNSNDVKTELHNVKEIYNTNDAFAALKNDGTVITWGSPNDGGDSSHVKHLLHHVTQIFSTNGAFAALKNDGTVVTWGDPMKGADERSIYLTNVIDICATRFGFVVLTKFQILISAGYVNEVVFFDVLEIHCTNWGFAAFTKNNTVQIWKNADSGQKPIFDENIKKIVSTRKEFATLKKNGTLIFYESYGIKRRVENMINLELFNQLDNHFISTDINGTNIIW